MNLKIGGLKYPLYNSNIQILRKCNNHVRTYFKTIKIDKLRETTYNSAQVGWVLTIFIFAHHCQNDASQAITPSQN